MDKRAGELRYKRYNIHYRLYGNSVDRLIVCVSGAKQTMSSWRSFVRHFNHSGYSVLVFDLPGQGRSEIVEGTSKVELDEQVDIMLAVCDVASALAYRQKYLIGGSWGSIVAAAFLAEWPEYFDKAILGSFGTKPNAVLAGVIDSVQRYIEEERGAEIASLMIASFGQFIPDSLKNQMLLQFSNMSSAQIQALYEHSLLVKEMEDLKRYIDLARIETPTLVMMGGQDTIMDPFDARNAASLMQNSQFRVIPEAGHFLHWERPELLDQYEQFFSECATVRTIVRVQ